MDELQIKRITYQNLWITDSKTKRDIPEGSNFYEILKEKVEEQKLKFSKHAMDRIKERNIKLTEEDINRINKAVKKAEEKGVRDTLIFMNNTAYIINVKNKTVITAVNEDGLKENVFTNIDGVIFV